jgi:hypothetical protein
MWLRLLRPRRQKGRKRKAGRAWCASEPQGYFSQPLPRTIAGRCATPLRNSIGACAPASGKSMPRERLPWKAQSYEEPSASLARRRLSGTREDEGATRKGTAARGNSGTQRSHREPPIDCQRRPRPAQERTSTPYPGEASWRHAGTGTRHDCTSAIRWRRP